MDVKTEAEILTSFVDVVKNKKTLLLVTHRLQNLGDVDLIYVLKNGVITESGTHSELLSLQGEYYAMQKLQMKCAEIKTSL